MAMLLLAMSRFRSGESETVTVTASGFGPGDMVTFHPRDGTEKDPVAAG